MLRSETLRSYLERGISQLSIEKKQAGIEARRLGQKILLGKRIDEHLGAMLPVLMRGERKRNKVHPSELHDGCSRKLWYDINEEEFSDLPDPIPASLQLTFDIGHFVHLYVQECLRQQGILEAAEYPIRNRKRKVDGRADGIVNLRKKRYVLEVKTHGDFTTKHLKYAPIEKHEGQASFYANELIQQGEQIDGIIYLYINKNTSEIREFIRPVRKDLVRAMNKIVDEGLSKTLPSKRKCKVSDSQRACSCPYRTTCWDQS
ncbi:PD-(D/E)XK nuclease family protein [Flammeovirga agarivorans]|uniref:Uncharacterized protein n=1 Tax=Flammeovirga agarivorans TaxID=2726742 RepID=A0A7X8SR81_9BACT|nr:PD-(D/E)XK nuclease family protein [Flammeovirga agarivorans]NLR94920.1 hypothetical protein [Flammeovirga agarivorans]